MKNNFQKRLLCAVLGIIMAFGLTACGDSTNDNYENSANAPDSKYDNVNLTFAAYYSRDTSQSQAITDIAEYLEEKSGGAITVDVYYENSIGNENELANGQIDGSVDLIYSGTTGGGLFVSEIGVFESFFAFEDEEAKENVYEQVKDDIAAVYEEKGFKLLGVLNDGPRYIYSTMPITSIEDVQDVPFRTPSSEPYASCISALGNSGISMPLADCYTSLQTGIIDIVEGGLELCVTNKYYEQCKYATSAPHVRYYTWITFSLKNWNKLNTATQELIQEAVDVAMVTQKEAWEAKQDVDKQYLIDQGVTFTEITDWDKWVEICDKHNAAFAASKGEVATKIYEAIKAEQG